MLPRLAIVALFAALIAACAETEEDPQGGSEECASPQGGEVQIATAAPEDYPLPSASQTVTIDDRLYNVAGEVPGFAGLSDGGDQASFIIYMADASTGVDTIRAGLVKHIPQESRFADWELRAVPVRYSWRELYDWYQLLRSAGLPGWVTRDIDESCNVLNFGVRDEAAAEVIAERIAEFGVPDDAVVVVSGVEIVVGPN